MTFIVVFLWLLSALMIAMAATRLYEKASEDIKQIFRGCGGKKGVFFIVFFGVFALVAIVGSILHPRAMVSGSKVRSGGISSEPIVKPLQTIRPTETTGTVITSEAPPIIKKSETAITPTEKEGGVRQPEPPPEIIRPIDKKLKDRR